MNSETLLPVKKSKFNKKYLLVLVILVASVVFAAIKFIPYFERITSSEYQSAQYDKEIAKQIADAKRPLAKNAPLLDWPITNLAANGNTVLSGLPGGSYMISEDAGVSWQIKTTGDFNFDFNQSAIHPNGTWMLLSNRDLEEQLVISRDKGLSWKHMDLGATSPNDNSYIRNIVMSQTGVLLILKHHGELHISSDIGSTWQSVGKDAKLYGSGLSHLNRASTVSVDRVITNNTSSLNLTYEETAVRDAIHLKSNALLSADLASIYEADQDFAWSSDFKHWFLFKRFENTIKISHDSGNTFVDAKIKKSGNSSPSNTLNDSSIVTSAISDDGKFAVVIFKNDTKEVDARIKYEALGEHYSLESMKAPEKNYADISSRANAPGTKTYEVFVSRDSGASFEQMSAPLVDYDIAGIQIIDSARGEFFVFQHGVSGISRYQSSTGKFQNYSTGFHAVGAAALSSNGWLFAGTRLMALTPNGMIWLTESATSEDQIPIHIKSHTQGQYIITTDTRSNMLMSLDYGESWQHSRLPYPDSELDRIESITVENDSAFLVSTNASYSKFYKDASTQPSSQANGDSTLLWWKSKDGKAWQNMGTSPEKRKEPPSPLTWKISLGGKTDDIDFEFSRWDCDESRQKNGKACIAVYGSRLYLSKDGGKTWSLLNPDDLLGKDIKNALISTDGKHLVVFTINSILFSRDGGLSFQVAAKPNQKSDQLN